MTVITFVNPKGGVGKTTTAIITAMELDRAGAKVAFYDLDPNANVLGWNNNRASKGLQTNFHIKGRPEDIEDVLEDIEELNSNNDYVIVDLEGTRDKIVTYTLSATDFAIIPTNGSTMEVIQGAETVRLIESTSKMTRRKIPYSFIFTRMNAAFKSIDEKSVASELDRNGIPYLETRLITRSPYSQIFRESLTLVEIRMNVMESTAKIANSKNQKAIEKIDKAIKNASELTNEIIQRIEKGDN